MPAETATRSRRALLAGLLGGAAAGVLGQASRAEAANGDTVKVGQSHGGSGVTQITSSASAIKGKSTGATGLVGETTLVTGFGVNGISTGSGSNRVGVRGSAAGTNGTGVLGVASRGVLGQSGGANGVGVVGKNTATSGTGSGIRGFAFSPSGQGVYAENSAASGAGTALHAKSSTDTTALVESVSGNANAVGLKASADGTGVEGKGRVGVSGEADSNASSTGSGAHGVSGVANKADHFGGFFTNLLGPGLGVRGRVLLQDVSGKSTIDEGSDSVTVTPFLSTVSSFQLVIATLQSDAGGPTVERVSVGSGNFTIFLTANAAQSCTVGWLILG